MGILEFTYIQGGYMTAHKIFWTETDEAPYLATYSLLPIIQGFTKG
ncbi:MAG: NADP-dependent isocitrate dehydrogenase, partial [Candidatus Aminicenantes bacterium]|nr:NADP-dependent isocitrate dehydrogenase [Candidatus Aminicenantes bacterium]